MRASMGTSTQRPIWEADGPGFFFPSLAAVKHQAHKVNLWI